MHGNAPIFTHLAVLEITSGQDLLEIKVEKWPTMQQCPLERKGPAHDLQCNHCLQCNIASCFCANEDLTEKVTSLTYLRTCSYPKHRVSACLNLTCCRDKTYHRGTSIALELHTVHICRWGQEENGLQATIFDKTSSNSIMRRILRELAAVMTAQGTMHP